MSLGLNELNKLRMNVACLLHYNFHERVSIRKCRLQGGVHFVLASALGCTLCPAINEKQNAVSKIRKLLSRPVTSYVITPVLIVDTYTESSEPDTLSAPIRFENIK